MRTKTTWCPILTMITAIVISFSGCGYMQSEVNEMEGSITGNTYTASFYDNSGDLFLTTVGEKIYLSENIVKEQTYSSEGGWGYTKTLSSVITITIDGSQIESCGSTIIFAEEGLEPDVDFYVERIESQAEGIGDNTLIAKIVNDYKNKFGKPVVVVIQSQLGDNITAYSGKDVYWEVCQDLPKTTKLMIDGKALYIHRANFQIIDTDLLDK